MGRAVLCEVERCHLGRGGSNPCLGSQPQPLSSHVPPLPPPAEVDVWNPSFDVTPHELITGGIITEWGVFAPSELCRALAERREH